MSTKVVTANTGFPAYGLIVHGSANDCDIVSPSTAGFVLIDNGSGVDPSFGAITVSMLPDLGGFTDALPPPTARFPFALASAGGNRDCALTELAAALAPYIPPAPGPAPANAPTSLAGTPGLNQISWAWTAPTGSPGATSYVLVTADDSGFTVNVSVPAFYPSSSPYVETGLTTIRYAMVAGINGGVVGPYSTVASATPLLPATAYTFTGPTSGLVSVASTDFTVTPTGGVSTATITPASTGSGTFTPTSVTFSGSGAQTFTYTPSSTAGSPHTISVTNNGGYTDPSSINYTVTSPPPPPPPGPPTPPAGGTTINWSSSSGRSGALGSWDGTTGAQGSGVCTGPPVGLTLTYTGSAWTLLVFFGGGSPNTSPAYTSGTGTSVTFTFGSNFQCFGSGDTITCSW